MITTVCPISLTLTRLGAAQTPDSKFGERKSWGQRLWKSQRGKSHAIYGYITFLITKMQITSTWSEAIDIRVSERTGICSNSNLILFPSPMLSTDHSSLSVQQGHKSTQPTSKHEDQPWPTKKKRHHWVVPHSSTCVLIYANSKCVKLADITVGILECYVDLYADFMRKII